MTLADFLPALAGGALTYPAAKRIFAELAAWGIELSSRQKRGASYVISFGLALVALWLAAQFGYMELTNETIFQACSGAFAASQLLHGWLDLKRTDVTAYHNGTR